jgi:methylaspartate ammonia-lyase
MVTYIKNLEEIVSPFKLRIEGPVDASSREETMLILKEMTDILNKESSVKLVADEWCNSLEDIKEFASKKAVDMIQIKAPDLGGINNICEAILFCNKCGVDAYCGGSCNETDISSRITTNIAMACGAKLILAKPGMGCDEGYMICKNEMNRILAIHKEEKKV